MNHAANVPRACSVHQHVPVWAPFCVRVTVCPLLPVHHPWTGVCMHLCTSRGLTQLRHSGPVSLHACLVLGLREAGSGFLFLGSRDASVPQSFSKSECCAGVPAPPTQLSGRGTWSVQCASCNLSLPLLLLSLLTPMPPDLGHGYTWGPGFLPGALASGFCLFLSSACAAWVGGAQAPTELSLVLWLPWRALAVLGGLHWSAGAPLSL